MSIFLIFADKQGATEKICPTDINEGRFAMEPHDEHDKKTQIFEKLDKLLKGVIALTCLTGVIAVVWLCTVGRAKAQETAKVTPETTQSANPEIAAEVTKESDADETEIVSETENSTETETETEDNATVTARAVPMVPYGYEDRTETETEAGTEDIPDEDHFASADERYRFDFRELWPDESWGHKWYNGDRTYEPRQYNYHKWPSAEGYDNDYSFQEGRIYFFWF